MDYSPEEIKKAIEYVANYKGGAEFDKHAFIVLSYLYSLQDEVVTLTYKYNSLIDELDKHGLIQND